jgi:hypothetical protein
MNSKYKENDLIKVIKKQATVMEMAHKYGSSYQAIKKALYRYGYRCHKRIKISSPYKKDVYVDDIQKCADELKVGRTTIIRALKGESVPMFDELNIKVEYVEEIDDE